MVWRRRTEGLREKTEEEEEEEVERRAEEQRSGRQGRLMRWRRGGGEL